MAEPHVHFGPFTGINTRKDPHLLSPGELLSASNVVFKGGAITPRPGLSPFLTANPLQVQMLVTESTTDVITAMYVDRLADPRRLVYAVTDLEADTSDLMYAEIDDDTGALGTPASYATGLPRITGLYIYRLGADEKVWMSHADGTISYYDLDTPGVTTFASTGVAIPAGLWYVPGESRVYFVAADNTPAVLRGVWCVTSGGTPVQLSASGAYPTLASVQLQRDDILQEVLMSCTLDGETYSIRRVSGSGGTSGAISSTALHESDVPLLGPCSGHLTTYPRRRWFIEDGGSSAIRVNHIAYRSSETRHFYSVLPYSEPLAAAYDGGYGDELGGNLYVGVRISASSLGIYRVDARSLSLPVASWRLNSVLDSGSAEGTPVPTSLGLIQNLDTLAGGSRCSVLMQHFNSSGVDDSAVVPLPAGFTDYDPEGWTPSIFHMIERDADPDTAYDKVLPAGVYGRFSAAFAGGGLTSDQGGYLLAGGTGGYIFNYSAPEAEGDTSFTLHMTYDTAPSGGTFKLCWGGEETSALAYNVSAADVKAALAALTFIDAADITATGGPFPADDIQITISGAFEDVKLPPPTTSNNSLTGGNFADVVVSEYTPGQSAPNGMLWLYPAGIPRPYAGDDLPEHPVYVSAAVTAGTPGAGYPILGVYKYVITLYSSALQLESPPSEEMRVVIGDYDTAEPSYAIVSWSMPEEASSTLWFNDYFGRRTGLTYAGGSQSVPIGPVVDKVRIYRRREGARMISKDDTDSLGAFMDFRLVAEVPINNSAWINGDGGGYVDSLSDTALLPATQPAEKGYPPDDAQYVAVIADHAYWVGSTSGTRTVWSSRGTLVGGIDDGEYGHVYVGPYNYVVLGDAVARGTGITAIRGFNGYLMVWTEDSLHMGDVSNVDDYGPAFTLVDGIAGCASHWAIAETGALPNYAGGLLLYAHPRGGIYAFDGTRSSNIADDALAGELEDWSSLVTAFSGLVNPLRDPALWYWAWAGFDPTLNLMLFSVPLDDGTFRTYAYSLEGGAWSSWTPSIYGGVLLPSMASPTAAGLGRFQERLYVSQGGNLAQLVQGSSDGGFSFPWSVRTGDAPMSPQLEIRKVNDGVLLADHRGSSPGAADTDIAVSAYIDGTEYPLTPVASAPGEIAFSVSQRCRYLGLEFSGTKAYSISSPYIVGYGVQSGAGGMRMRNDIPSAGA